MEPKWKKFRKEQVLMAEAWAMQISNGVPILDSLKALSDGFIDYRDEWNAIKGVVEEGNYISQNLTEKKDAFHPLLIEAVKVGEAQGTLDVMLERAAEMMKEEITLEKKGYSVLDVNEIMFYNQLWLFTQNGESADEQKNLVSALERLAESSEAMPKKVWQSLHEQVVGGKSLSAAMVNSPGYFSTLAMTLISAGGPNLLSALALAGELKEESLDPDFTPEMRFYSVLGKAAALYSAQINPEVKEIIAALEARAGETIEEITTRIRETFEGKAIDEENAQKKSQDKRDRETESRKREYFQKVTLPSFKLAAAIFPYPSYVLEDMASRLESQEHPALLSEAMKEHPRHFSPIIVNLLYAAEQYQGIDVGLGQIQKYLKIERKMG